MGTGAHDSRSTPQNQPAPPPASSFHLHPYFKSLMALGGTYGFVIGSSFQVMRSIEHAVAHPSRPFRARYMLHRAFSTGINSAMMVGLYSLTAGCSHVLRGKHDAWTDAAGGLVVAAFHMRNAPLGALVSASLTASVAMFVVSSAFGLGFGEKMNKLLV